MTDSLLESTGESLIELILVLSFNSVISTCEIINDITRRDLHYVAVISIDFLL